VAARTKIVNEQEVLGWFAEGRSYRWMVEEYHRKYGVDTNPSMWGNFRRRRGLDRRNAQNDDLMPWKLRDEHRFAYPALMLRLEARRREGKDIRPVDLGRLTSWLRRLEEERAVVAYDPDDAEGFSYVDREPHDVDIIRRPTSATGKRHAVD
jgi:hypothetical protein